MEFILHQPLYISELGKRTGQEDSIFPPQDAASSETKLFIVCDGMGGHLHGEVASSVIANTLGAALSHAGSTTITEGDIANAVNQAYDKLDEAYANSGEEEGNKMGTTLTMLCMHQGGCLIGHIGDSRIYHIRPASKEIVNRTRDHSLVQQLFDMGEISEEEMRTSSKKNVILKAMQPKQARRTMPELKNITDVRPNDYFYLCSDGMLEKMDDNEIIDIIAKDGLSDEEKISILRNRTESNADNHSAYLIHIKDVIGGAAPTASVVDVTADSDVCMVEEEESVTPNVSVVQPKAQRPHKVVVTKRQNKSSNSTLIMALVALVIAIAAFAVYWFVGQSGPDPDDSPAPKRELPRKTGDDYLNEQSARRNTKQRTFETSNGSKIQVESKPTAPATNSQPAQQQPTTQEPAQQHQSAASAASQQVRNAAASAGQHSTESTASEAIRRAGGKSNGMRLERVDNVPNSGSSASQSLGKIRDEVTGAVGGNKE